MDAFIKWLVDLPHHIVSFAVSDLDISTDFKQGYDLFYGTNYTKHVDNYTSPFIHSDCTLTDQLGDETLVFECFEKDLIWAIITWAVLFLPGLQLYTILYANTTKDEDGDGVIDEDERPGVCKRVGFLLLCLMFPVTIFLVQFITIFYHPTKMKNFGIQLSTAQVELQSLTQLALQMYIVFKRADRFPTFYQWLTIGSSFVTISKGKMEEFITFIKVNDDEKLGFFKKQWNTVKYVPYFTALTLFRVSSFSLVLCVFGYYAISCYVFCVLFLMVVGACVGKHRDDSASIREFIRNQMSAKGLLFPILLPFRSQLTEVNDDKQPRTLFQGFWFLFNLLFIAGLNYLVNIGGGKVYDFLDLENIHIIQNHVYFNISIGIVFWSGALSFVLFVVQIRRKYNPKGNNELDWNQSTSRRESDIDHQDLNLDSEARKRADKIISRAKEEAEKIKHNAKQKAEQIKTDARKNMKTMKSSAASSGSIQETYEGGMLTSVISIWGKLRQKSDDNQIYPDEDEEMESQVENMQRGNMILEEEDQNKHQAEETITMSLEGISHTQAPSIIQEPEAAVFEIETEIEINSTDGENYDENDESPCEGDSEHHLEKYDAYNSVENENQHTGENTDDDDQSFRSIEDDTNGNVTVVMFSNDCGEESDTSSYHGEQNLHHMSFA